MKTEKEILERIDYYRKKINENREEIRILNKCIDASRQKESKTYFLDEVKRLENWNTIYFQQINVMKWILD